MAISSPGIGSGLDINTIVSQMVEVEKQPLKTLQVNASKLQSQISTFASIKSQLSSLQDAAKDLLSNDTWSSNTFTSANPSAVSGSVTSSASATSFSVQVTKLAVAQTARTSALATGASLNAGTLTLSKGTWAAGVFTKDSGADVEVLATDTLSSLATKINAKNAGVTALVITSAGQQQMLLKSSSTGASSGFHIEASADLENFGTPVQIYESAALANNFELDNTAADYLKITSPSGTVHRLSVADGSSLAAIANQFNAASVGVTAEVTSIDNQQKLVFRNNTPGMASFQIKAYDVNDIEITNGSGLSKFSTNDGNNGLTLTQGAGGITQSQPAEDATIKIDGLTVTSASNEVSNAITGLTLNLKSTTSTDVQITVEQNTEIIKTKITAFQTAYNTLMSNLKDLTKYDSINKKSGSLQGDGTAVGLINLLSQMISSEGPKVDRILKSSPFSRLSDVGLEMQQSGQLNLNTTKLTKALENIGQLKNFFYYYGGDNGSNGLARRFNDFVSSANGVKGALTTKNSALQTAISRNKTDQLKVSDRAEDVKARLLKQYSSLDTKMSTLSGLSTFVTNQVAQWNKTK
jgi:flagellar hook-associated protein 2